MRTWCSYVVFRPPGVPLPPPPPQLVNEIGSYSVGGAPPLFHSMCLAVCHLIRDNHGKNMVYMFFSMLLLTRIYVVDFCLCVCVGGGGGNENLRSLKPRFVCP